MAHLVLLFLFFVVLVTGGVVEIANFFGRSSYEPPARPWCGDLTFRSSALETMKRERTFADAARKCVVNDVTKNSALCYLIVERAHTGWTSQPCILARNMTADDFTARATLDGVSVSCEKCGHKKIHSGWAMEDRGDASHECYPEGFYMGGYAWSCYECLDTTCVLFDNNL